MPKQLEEKLKKEYGADSDVPYKIMNKMGVMHGNKETAKGKNMDKKAKMAKKGISWQGAKDRFKKELDNARNK